MIEQTPNTQHAPQNETSEAGMFSLHDLIQMILANWYWFAISVIVCLGAG